MSTIIYLPNTHEGLIRMFLAREKAFLGQLHYYDRGDLRERIRKISNAFLLFLSERSITFVYTVNHQGKVIEKNPVEELRYLPKILMNNLATQNAVTVIDVLREIFAVLHNWGVQLKYPRQQLKTILR